MQSPEPLIQVAAIVAGAGITETVQDQLKRIVPQLAPEMAGGIAGGLLYYFGDRIHPLVKALGVGLLAGSLSPWLSRAIRGGLAPAGSGSGGSSNPQTALQAARARYGRR